MKYRVIPHQSFIRVPWKNGLGFTHEIAKQMDQANRHFLWRLSIAEVRQDGPFSSFTGYTRNITVLKGAGMILTVDGQVSPRLRAFESYSFSGQATTSCQLIDGNINDFNVIYNPEQFSIHIDWFRPERFMSHCLPAHGIHFVIAGQGETTLEFQDTVFNLNPWDVLMIEANTDDLNLTFPGQKDCVTGLVHLIPLK